MIMFALDSFGYCANLSKPRLTCCNSDVARLEAVLEAIMIAKRRPGAGEPGVAPKGLVPLPRHQGGYLTSFGTLRILTPVVGLSKAKSHLARV